MLRNSRWYECLLIALAAALLVPHGRATATEYDIDPLQTSVSFEVRNLGVFAQRGTFNRATGTVTRDAQAGNGPLEIIVDATFKRTSSAFLPSNRIICLLPEG